MLRGASIAGAALAHDEWRSTNAQQRAVAIGLVLGLHLAVLASFVVAGLKAPPEPPEAILEVSLLSAEPVAAAQPSQAQPAEPTPPVPTPRPPEPTLLSTPAPTPSAMSAPPVERRPADPAPAAPAPSPAPAPAAASADAPAATTGPVTPPNFSAAYLNNPGPVYPPSSRRKREEGVVRLRVHVSAEGKPSQVLLERSSGSSDLDEAALDVVRKRWRFAPAQQAGKPVAAWVIVPLEFSLKR
ncbi:energy transducer TonB [Phenylobacterium sp.]|jgi:protein TonB|uniref:energy transducer TonB n=1 Tax=Phenylobacterium sp. TaxID=1871053 RepID=UPI002E36004B|nr:energy transducer TonB [Phenylobacterium sp.]HEX2561339.1 energy transducer TonB [Phenylobacterium sp.]